MDAYDDYELEPEDVRRGRWMDALESTSSFLSDNEQYGDDWSSELKAIDEMLDSLQYA